MFSLKSTIPCSWTEYELLVNLFTCVGTFITDFCTKLRTVAEALAGHINVNLLLRIIFHLQRRLDYHLDLIDSCGASLVSDSNEMLRVVKV